MKQKTRNSDKDYTFFVVICITLNEGSGEKIRIRNSDDEISSMRSEDDHYLEIYQVLNKKGYSFSAQNGFYKETERNKKWN